MQELDFSSLYRITPEAMCHFEDKIVIAEVHKDDLFIEDIFPVRLLSFTFFLIEEGSIEVELDYTLHSLGKNSFLAILPEHLIHNIRLSTNFKARMMIAGHEYFGTMDINKNRLYQPASFNIRKNPTLSLMAEEFEVINSCFDRIEQKICLANHHLKHEIIKVLLTEYILEMDNILINRNFSANFQRLSRQEQLLYDFFQLLQENGKNEHKVVFYADKLHVTTQYLALVLKQLTGKTTHEWISDALVIEAKVQLKHTRQSVQQIADSLNFCDPSAFGKFFKNQTGNTPHQYRKIK